MGEFLAFHLKRALLVAPMLVTEVLHIPGTWRYSVETGSGHPGHIFSGSSGSNPVYNLSGSDPDWIT